GDRNCLVMAGLFSAALIFFYPLVLPTPLLEPDEGLHATISQEMLEHGEWIVPTVHGQPFLDKPILYFWTQMIGLKTFGMHEWAVRLPGLLFGLLGSLTTGLLAWRLFGRQIAAIATLMSMTMFLPLVMAQAATHDVALVPWTNLAILCLWATETSSTRRQQVGWLAGAACMVGLAILTKALIGVAIVCIGYGLFLIFSRRLSLARCVRLAVVLLVGLLMASPWFIAMEIRDRGYLYYYFIERHLLGFATSTQPHGEESWYYYAPFVLLGSIPWSWTIVPLLFDEWRGRKSRTATAPEMILLLCWLIGGLLFLSIAKSKLSTYALPLFPAIAILTAVSWQRFVDRQCSAATVTWFSWMNRLSGVAGAIAPIVAMLGLQLLLHTTWPAICWLAAGVVSAISIASLIDAENKRYARSFALCCTWIAGMVAILMTWPFQNVAESYSERRLAEWINRQDYPGNGR
ncbi:MAG TPA: glycosyltransferase family 39 protein, partial [Planctomycetaceae bacterium]|nr:glycosyltransferase family 39 protein [Planctomycetaceae bacterium]